MSEANVENRGFSKHRRSRAVSTPGARTMKEPYSMRFFLAQIVEVIIAFLKKFDINIKLG